jgi:predicted nucleic acid-binding Zn ribbon protein
VSRRERPPKALQDLLGAAVGRPEILKTVRVMRAFRDWKAIVGEPLARKSAPVKYDHGVLIVHVASAVWALELRFQAEEIKRRLNELLGEDAVREVRFVEGPLSQEDTEDR